MSEPPVISALAVKASLPFAAMIVADEGARWRGAFAAGYLAALALIGVVAAGPDGVRTYLEAASAAYGGDALPLGLH